MAGQNRNEEGKKEISKNGIDVNQDEVENVIEEYDMLDSKLDELNSALNFLEQKNDDIHEQLKHLLQSNIEIRQEIQKQNDTTVQKN